MQLSTLVFPLLVLVVLILVYLNSRKTKKKIHKEDTKTKNNKIRQKKEKPLKKDIKTKNSKKPKLDPVWLDVIKTRERLMPTDSSGKFTTLGKTTEDEMGLDHANTYKDNEHMIPMDQRTDVAMDRIVGFSELQKHISLTGTLSETFHVNASLKGALQYAYQLGLDKDFINRTFTEAGFGDEPPYNNKSKSDIRSAEQRMLEVISEKLDEVPASERQETVENITRMSNELSKRLDEHEGEGDLLHNFSNGLVGLSEYFQTRPGIESIFNEIGGAIRNGYTVLEYLQERNLIDDKEIRKHCIVGFTDINLFLRDALEANENHEVRRDFNACQEAIDILFSYYFKDS